MLSTKDFIKILLGLYSIINKNVIIYDKRLSTLIIIYSFLISFLGWEWWWSIAPSNIPLCFKDAAMDYKTRAQICNIPENNTTYPQILHAISNSLSDVFIMMIIYFIGLKSSPNAFTIPLNKKNSIKFLFVSGICGLAQNLLLDSMFNTFPKYCCGKSGKEICPLSWAPLAPCQYCPNENKDVIPICWRTEFSWIITPLMTYILIILTLYKYNIKIRPISYLNKLKLC